MSVLTLRSNSATLTVNNNLQLSPINISGLYVSRI